ncbi:Uncharacterized protein E3U43_010555 [Larimichthys crocea]|uniref:Uncharacterized protein n=1 Tax=Larimichthys crocea TaxID=215358 RepID=A0ACD3RHR7_LARCR|nr:Uncharacterized protein E3U43_010555 [Larimichthys crocea]
MAACFAPTGFEIQSFLECNKSTDYLAQMLKFVSKHKRSTRHLKSPAGATLTIGNLDDTIYKEKPREVNGWGKFYLPNIVNMQVIGVVEGTSCPCDQLVLMTCEDTKVYGYDGEELHVVAASLKELVHEGIEYPASKSYYNGEAFKNMKDKDWDKVRNGAVGRRLDEEHCKLVTTGKSNLKNFKLTCGYLCHSMQDKDSSHTFIFCFSGCIHVGY